MTQKEQWKLAFVTVAFIMMLVILINFLATL